MQVAIGHLTASLDSPELEAWAALALIPEDPEALASVIAGLHLVNLLLLQQLHEATGQLPSTTLQKTAISAVAGPRDALHRIASALPGMTWPAPPGRARVVRHEGSPTGH
jgi:hypothetical protein